MRHPFDVRISSSASTDVVCPFAPESAIADAREPCTVTFPTARVGLRSPEKKISMPRSQLNPRLLNRAANEGASTSAQILFASLCATAAANCCTLERT